MRLLICCLLLLFGNKSLFAQETIAQKMEWLGKAKPTTNLFVHFDKNVYSNNETVYFTGYIVKDGKISIKSHKVMALILIREVDSALISEDKFILNDGISFGSLTLPDSIPAGNYRFLVFTDKLVDQMPELQFIQNITIKSSLEPTFNANVKLIEQGSTEINSNKILVSAYTPDNRFLAKPATISYRYGKINKSIKSDASGQSIINLPTQTNLTDPNVYIKLKYGNDSTFINLDIPQHKNKANVKFYPEGGNIALGLTSKIAWEVKDQQNRPIALKAFLYKNAVVIDTIETSSYGIGNFNLKAEDGIIYTVKLIHNNLTDTTYSLPKAINNRITLTLPQAFVSDTLKVVVKSTEKLKFQILIHNFNTQFIDTPFELKQANVLIKIPLTDIPKGLATLTILDSLNRPLAERMFFAHYSDSEKIGLTTDKQIYEQRENVNLKLDLKTDQTAFVSIAVVQSNRLELKNTNDIESYTYINNELSTLPIPNNGRGFNNRNYLEQVLLVKGWRRYNWQDLVNIKATDTIATLDSLKINGQITRKKNGSSPLSVGILGSEKFNLISASANGSFNLTEANLIIPAEKKMYVFINGGEKTANLAKIKVNDEFDFLNHKLIPFAINKTILPSTLVNNTELLLKNNEKSIRLKEVVITNKNNNSIKGLAGANACGDYVCINKILNCLNHIGDLGNTQPIKGVSYITNRVREIYAGCSKLDQSIFTLVKGLHLHKEFYLNDYKDLLEPAFFSTIYWNYGTMLNANKETNLSFYTSDITGKFKIVVQGISNNDVIYGEHFFEVKPKVNP